MLCRSVCTGPNRWCWGKEILASCLLSLKNRSQMKKCTPFLHGIICYLKIVSWERSVSGIPTDLSHIIFFKHIFRTMLFVEIANWVTDIKSLKSWHLSAYYQPLQCTRTWEEVTAAEPPRVQLWLAGFVPVTGWHLPAGSVVRDKIKRDCGAFRTEDLGRSKTHKWNYYFRIKKNPNDIR